MQTMARKKKKTGRPAVPDPRLPIAAFRGKRAFAEWFWEFARRQRVPASIIIEQALVHYAAHLGYEPEPPER